MKCKNCDKPFKAAHHSEKYCSDECRRVSKNRMHKIGMEIRKSAEDYTRYLIENLLNCITEPYHLTTTGFNSVSKVGFKSYINHFKRMQWIDILKMVGLDEKLFMYTVSEYKKFVLTSGKQNLHLFCKEHKYITYSLLQSIGLDRIMESARVRKLRYNENELKENFLMIKKKLGRIPLYSEFKKLSKISIATYAEKFKLKGEIYHQVIKMFCSEQEISEYLDYRRDYKSKIGRETGKLSAIYTDEDYIKELHRVFKLCLEEYGEFPPKRLFNSLSKFNDRSYRKKFKDSWSNICKKFGYEIDNSHKSERMLLNLIKKMTKCDYIPQKTFYWLKNDNGYPLYCDGYYERIKLIVELDGVQHRKPVEGFGGIKSFEKLKRNDAIKNELIPKKGFKLLRIDSREKWYDAEYIKKRLAELGISIES
jgi:hypothetical protein